MKGVLAASQAGLTGIGSQKFIKKSLNLSSPIPPSDYYAYWDMTLLSNTISSVGTRSATSNTVDVSPSLGVYGTESCSFNGTSSYVDLGFNDNFSSEMTWAFWVYPIASGGEIISKISFYAASVTDFPFTVIAGVDSIVAAFSYGNDYSADITLTSPVVYNRWSHIAITYKASTSAKIYKDGVLQDSAIPTGSISTNTRNWVFGRSSYPYGGGVPGRFYSGYLDEVYLYNRELTSTEIQSFIV